LTDQVTPKKLFLTSEVTTAFAGLTFKACPEPGERVQGSMALAGSTLQVQGSKSNQLHVVKVVQKVQAVQPLSFDFASLRSGQAVGSIGQCRPCTSPIPFVQNVQPFHSVQIAK